MTTEERELVERLRAYAVEWNEPEASNAPVLDAASLIERIAKERDEARDRADRTEAALRGLNVLYLDHKETIENLKAERDRTSREFYEYALKMEGKK